MTIAVSILVAFLMLILYQDQKNRAIWWFLPPIIFLLGLFITYPTIQWFDMLWSSLFIAFLIGSLYGYIFLRFRNLNLFKSYFGLGDLLILISITPFFSFRQFVFFFTAATLCSLVIFAIASLFVKQQTIPYAGYIALIFGLHIVIKQVFNVTFFDLIHV